jgi:hypothetical protein
MEVSMCELLDADIHDEYTIVNENEKIYEIRNEFFKKEISLSTKRSVLVALEYLHSVRPNEFVRRELKDKSLIRYSRIVRNKITSLFTYVRTDD